MRSQLTGHEIAVLYKIGRCGWQRLSDRIHNLVLFALSATERQMMPNDAIIGTCEGRWPTIPPISAPDQHCENCRQRVNLQVTSHDPRRGQNNLESLSKWPNNARPSRPSESDSKIPDANNRSECACPADNWK